MLRIERDSIDDIAVDSLLHHYQQIKQRASELKSMDRALRPYDEVIGIGQNLRAIEIVLEYYGISDIPGALELYNDDIKAVDSIE